MANYRQIHTKIWKDGWFINLSPEEKLLFIYLFSNERACLAGIYELPLCVIAFETGLTEERVRDCLDAFAKAEKAFYENGVVWIVNLIRYNAHSLTNPKIRGNIESSLEEVPNCPLKKAWVEHYNQMVPEEQQIDSHSGDADRVSIGYRQVILHEQEQEHEQEHTTNGAQAPGNPLPHHLNGWLDFIREGKGAPGGRTARLGIMLATLWPTRYEGLDPPYSKIGGVARNVGGASRLAHLLWQANAYKVTGDPLEYCSKMHKNSRKRGGNGKNQRNNRKGQSRRYTADDIPEITEEQLKAEGYNEAERKWLLDGEGPDPWAEGAADGGEVA
jgi:hypothetical protein